MGGYGARLFECVFQKSGWVRRRGRRSGRRVVPPARLRPPLDG